MRTFVAALLGGLVASTILLAVLLMMPTDLLGTRLVRSAMVKHPDILTDAAEALQERQFAPLLNANRAALETPFASSWRGSEKPDVVLVEFYDYACPFCKTSNPDVDRLLAEDRGLRVVYRELPILGPYSLDAARVSLAASGAGRFRQFHEALFNAGRPNPQTIAIAARAAGISTEAALTGEGEAELRRNLQFVGQLGSTATPLFIVGDKVIHGAVGYEALKSAVADARDR